jgi:hypothetical protein
MTIPPIPAAILTGPGSRNSCREKSIERKLDAAPEACAVAGSVSEGVTVSGKETADRMLLPARRFHDSGDRCALCLAQHCEYGFLFR